MDLRSETNAALSRRLADALDNLAQAYVSVYGEKEGMEKICDNFFEDAVRQHYPDGWTALVRYAMKMAG
ncbi:hypothetical protein PO883_31770 [Massilia sp. DJPM01]|uniref:hypothetical protein n=1 Tax=Massilia sp. DJPM01 TaxID=3024404 RepID=UPI00259F34ED|nr:hypothetical protein [Massilia sp. DJPM01]MDM5181761.1 hypothetical protein [Massilia sp. DJPM01]